MSPRSKRANQEILDKRREQILSAALKVFARRGFAATKISDIASSAGLSHGLVYHYFKTKDEIFTELVKRALGILGIPEYVSQLDISPLEKLRNIVEMIISAAYQGDGLYYWHIVNQAYISEAIPDDVKELISKKRYRFSDSLIPIIIEGQELGQITMDDPLVLYTTLYSTLNGMAMQQMRARNIPDYPVSLPDADIIMRLLKNPETRDEPSIPHGIESRFGEATFIYKRLVYRFRDSVEADFKILKVAVMETVEKGKRIYRIESEKETGEKVIALISAENWMPINIELSNSKENTVSKIEYRDNAVSFDIPDRKIHKTIKLHGEYYDSHTLSFILQAFPFESDEKMKITLIYDGSGGIPVGPYGMEFQRIGRERVTVPAGDFDCYKLEMGIVGFDEISGGMYRYYFWYAADEPHFLVKYEDKQGKLRELVRFE